MNSEIYSKISDDLTFVPSTQLQTEIEQTISALTRRIGSRGSIILEELLDTIPPRWIEMAAAQEDGDDCGEYYGDLDFIVVFNVTKALGFSEDHAAPRSDGVIFRRNPSMDQLTHPTIQ